MKKRYVLLCCLLLSGCAYKDAPSETELVSENAEAPAASAEVTDTAPEEATTKTADALEDTTDAEPEEENTKKNADALDDKGRMTLYYGAYG